MTRATDSAYSSSDHEYPWPLPTRDNAGSRARAEEQREYRSPIRRIGFREYGWGNTDPVVGPSDPGPGAATGGRDDPGAESPPRAPEGSTNRDPKQYDKPERQKPGQ